MVKISDAREQIPEPGKPRKPLRQPVLMLVAAFLAAVTWVGCQEAIPAPPDTAPRFADTVADRTFTVGEAVDLALPAASGGNGALTYSLRPTVPGLTFHAATRTLSGAPTTAGTFSMTYTVVDGDDNFTARDAAVRDFTITVVDPEPPDTAPRFADTVTDLTFSVGETVSVTLPAASGGNGSLTYSLQPTVPGLTFHAATRSLSGTPTTAGIYSMTYTVTDGDDNLAASDADAQQFSITVVAQPPPDTAPHWLDTVADLTLTVGETVDLTLPPASGGNGPLSYSLRPSVPGLSFATATRTLSGSPTTTGTYPMTYTVVDGDDNHDPGDTAVQAFTITVVAQPPPDTAPRWLDTVADLTFNVGVPVDLTLSAASGGNGSLTYSLQPTVPGLTFHAATRTLSGSPTTAGTYSMTYLVVDADDNHDPGDTAVQSFTITVAPAPPPDTAPRWLDSVADLTFNVGVPVELTLPLASGGNGPLSYSLLPSVPGLSFDPATRTLSGTPTAAGSYPMTYTVVDADDNHAASDTGMQTFTITVVAAGPPPLSDTSEFAEVTEMEQITIDGGDTVVAAKNEVLIYVDENASQQDLAALYGRIAAHGGTIAGSLAEMGTLQVRIPEGMSESQFAESLEGSSGVSGAGLNLQQRYDEIAAVEPTANLVSASHGGTYPSFDDNYWIEQIDLHLVWRFFTRGSRSADAAIGIVDSGIPASQRFISEHRLFRFDLSGLFGERIYDDGYPAEDHGSQVTCFASANSFTTRGVAWRNAVVSVDITDRTGADSGTAATSEILHAIGIALRRGAAVINVSWGKRLDPGWTESQKRRRAAENRLAYNKAVLAAKRRDVLLVFAAGNDRFKADHQLLPHGTNDHAWRTHALIVASVGQYNRESGFSRFGSAVDLAAPGESLSCGLKKTQGTSLAAPIVAGVAALIKGVNPSLTAPEIRSIILRTASPNVVITGSGHPRIQLNACAALEAAMPDTAPSTNIVITPSYYYVGRRISPLVLPEVTGGNPSCAGGYRYSLTPTVPGLTFDPDTHTLSGTPTAAGVYDMTYRVEDADGDAYTDDFQIIVRVPDTAPRFGSDRYTVEDRIYIVNRPIEPWTLPEATGGNGNLSYTLGYANLARLPDGLSFDPATRTLSGTPTLVGTYNMHYVVEDSDANTARSDTDRIPFTIRVQNPTPAGRIYWATGHGSIQRATLDGSNVEYIRYGNNDDKYGGDALGGIALDVAAGKIYWTDHAEEKIWRADLDGANVEELVTGLVVPSYVENSIALDPGRGKMYWTDPENSKIYRAGLDGSNVEDLVADSHFPVGIALDLGAGKMYWTESGGYKVRRADLDGSNVEDLATGLVDFDGSDIALDSRARKMYWTGRGPVSIYRANLDGSGVEDVFGDYFGDIGQIALDPTRGTLYYTQGGRIVRTDIVTSFEHLIDGLGDLVDIALDGS